MTDHTSVFAKYGTLRELHDRTYARHSNDQRQREAEPTYTLDRQVAAWKAETPPDRVAALHAQWAEDEALFEAARVEHGRGTPAYRAAHRAIVNRPVRQPDPAIVGSDLEGRN